MWILDTKTFSTHISKKPKQLAVTPHLELFCATPVFKKSQSSLIQHGLRTMRIALVKKSIFLLKPPISNCSKQALSIPALQPLMTFPTKPLRTSHEMTFELLESFLNAKDLSALATTSHLGERIRLQRIKNNWLNFLNQNTVKLEKIRQWLCENISENSEMISEELVIHWLNLAIKRTPSSKENLTKAIANVPIVTTLLRILHNDFSIPTHKLVQLEITPNLLNNEIVLKHFRSFQLNDSKDTKHSDNCDFLNNFYKLNILKKS
ncbi:MAG: hypothetical protein V4629_12335 [Pseudomonadota bacterium]